MSGIARGARESGSGGTIERRPLVAEVIRAARGDLVVSGLGSPTWDVFAAGDRPENLYSWGAMGLAVPTGLGLAMAQPTRRVLVITGDGEMMMGVGSLAVVAAEAPENLAILVLDNEHFGETGRQKGLTGAGADLEAVARASGIAATRTIRTRDESAQLARFLAEEPGPVFAVAKIALTREPWALPEKDGATIMRRFQAVLTCASLTRPE